MWFKSFAALSAATALGVKGQASSDQPSPTSASASASQPSGSASASASASALPTWSWTNGTQKMHGVNLGNWLILEKWMANDWFAEACGNETAEDQWSFIQSIGDEDRAREVLQEHYNSWITTEDIVNISQAGFNSIRIPMGYWSWIDPLDDTPYINAGEIDQLNRILEVATENGLYSIIDIHGLPGSQNGEQASGHVGENAFLYNDDYQAAGDRVIDAVIDFVQNSTYKSSISAVAACNEPVYYTEAQYDTLVGFYERSYEKMSSAGIPLMFHPGTPDSSALALWESFIAGKDPNLAIFEIHPYPGRGGTLSGENGDEPDPSSLYGAVCYWADQFRGYGVPVAVTEWSLVSGIVNNTDFYRNFFEAQTTAWAESAGSLFWSWKLNSSQLSDVSDNRVYSYIDLLNDGIVPSPSDGQNATEFLDSLQNYCNNTSTEETWSSPVASGSATVTAAFPDSSS